MEDDHERVVSVTSLSVQLFTVPTMVSTPAPPPLRHHTPVSPSLSVLLVELWTLAVRLRERRPWPWVLHYWPVSTNIHRPIAGEFSLIVCVGGETLKRELFLTSSVHFFKHNLLSGNISKVYSLVWLLKLWVVIFFYLIIRYIELIWIRKNFF